MTCKKLDAESQSEKEDKPELSTSDKANTEGLFIGVHIDFAEFCFAVLDEKWKDIEEEEDEKKAPNTPIYQIELPQNADRQELLVETIVAKLEEYLKLNFWNRLVKSIVISYNESDECYSNLKDNFTAAVGKLPCDPEGIECIRISTLYHKLIFTDKNTQEWLQQYKNGDSESTMLNGVLFWGSTIWSVIAEATGSVSSEDVVTHSNKISVPSRYFPGLPEDRDPNVVEKAIYELGSAYAIARNVIRTFSKRDFVGGEYLLQLIGEHFELENPRDIVRLMDEGGNRVKLAYFTQFLILLMQETPCPIPEKTKIIIEAEFKWAGAAIMDNYINLKDDSKKMRLFVIGFGFDELPYFQFYLKMANKPASIRYYRLDEKLDRPEMAAAYFASTKILGRPLKPLGAKDFVICSAREGGDEVQN